MIPDDTLVWVIICTVDPSHMPYGLYSIKRVIKTTWGDINKKVSCDWNAREQMLTFFRPDKAPWDKGEK